MEAGKKDLELEMFSVFVFALGMIISAVLLFTMVYYVISFYDLESDHVNPTELCSNLNELVIPEYAIHAAMSALFLLTLHIFPSLWNAPLVAWHYQQYTERRHWYDPTEIFRRLPDHKRECYVKLASLRGELCRRMQHFPISASFVKSIADLMQTRRVY